MRFDFSEEAINEMYDMYKQALATTQQKTKAVVNSLQERARDLKYKPVIKLTQDAVAFYNDDLKDAERAALEDWKQSDCSFTKLIDEMSAGEQARTRSKELESSIEGEIDSWRSIDASALTTIDTTHWHCEPSDFEDLKHVIDNYIGALDDMKREYGTKIDSQKSENGIYVAIEPVVIQSISIVAVGFREGISASFETLASEFDVRSQKVARAGAHAAQQAVANSSKHISGKISALNSKVKAIWD